MTNDCRARIDYSNGGPPFLLCSCYVTRYTPAILPVVLAILPAVLPVILPAVLPVILPSIHPYPTCYPAISFSRPGQTGIPFHQPHRFPRPSSRLFPGNRENHFPRTIRSSCFRHRQTSTIHRQSASNIQSHGFRPHRYSSSMPHSDASPKYRKFLLPRKLPGPQPWLWV